MQVATLDHAKGCNAGSNGIFLWHAVIESLPGRRYWRCKYCSYVVTMYSSVKLKAPVSTVPQRWHCGMLSESEQSSLPQPGCPKLTISCWYYKLTIHYSWWMPQYATFISRESYPPMPNSNISPSGQSPYLLTNSQPFSATSNPKHFPIWEQGFSHMRNLNVLSIISGKMESR